MDDSDSTHRPLANAAIVLAVVLVCVLAAIAFFRLQPILDDPANRRGEVVAVLAPPLVSIASALLVRRRAERPVSSAVFLGFAAGMAAYSVPATSFVVLGGYGVFRSIAGSLILGVWFALFGLLALAPALVYVACSMRPQPAIAVGLSATVFLAQWVPIASPVIAVLVYSQRDRWRSLA